MIWRFWQRFGSKLRYVCQWAPKITWQPDIVPLQRNVHFAYVNCYIFANCPQTPTSTSNLTVPSKSQWNVDSDDILYVRKYCQLFTHESNTFLLQNTPLKPMGQLGAKHVINHPFPSSHMEPHSIHQCLGPPNSPRQTTARSVYATSALLRNKVPISYNGTPQIHPKTASSSSTITTPI